MLPMRLITPAQASIASLSIVFPDDAWPTTAKFRMSPGLYSFIDRKFSTNASSAAQRHGFKAKEFMEGKGGRKRIRSAKSETRNPNSESNPKPEGRTDSFTLDSSRRCGARSRIASSFILRFRLGENPIAAPIRWPIVKLREFFGVQL